ncbi:MAG: LysM peptidoglycan-binding domain-containing protein [Turicibacter sp.]|nr:LysM peptidoglycan-binding domain-containing protein [Turicibacter sp.]
MSKKLMLFLMLFNLFALVACTDDADETPPVEEETEPTTEPEEAFTFFIEILTEDELAELEHVTSVAYRDGTFEDGLNLLFNFSHPVTDFTFIGVTVVEDGSAVKTGILNEVGDIALNAPLVLTDYFVMGTLPTSGFYFVDPDGESNWYVFQQSQMDGNIHWRPFDWSHDYDLLDYFYHEVVAGNTLFSLSQQHGTTVEVLQQLNGLGTSTDITVGQLLRIPVNPTSPDTGNVAGMTPEVAPITTPDIRIEWLRETRHDVVEFNYADARGVRAYHTDTLLIAPATVLREFAVISVYLDMMLNAFEAVDVLFFVGYLHPHQPLLIREYFGMGTFPASGFTFIDEAGVRRFFTFNESPTDYGGFFMNEFFQEDVTFWD